MNGPCSLLRRKGSIGSLGNSISGGLIFSTGVGPGNADAAGKTLLSLGSPEAGAALDDGGLVRGIVVPNVGPRKGAWAQAGLAARAKQRASAAIVVFMRFLSCR